MGVIKDANINEQLRVRLFMKEYSVRKTNTRPPKDFLSAIMTDGDTDIDCKLWNYIQPNEPLQAKMCYDVVATVGAYNGVKQLTLTDLKLSNNQDIQAFTINVGYTSEQLWAAATEAIHSIKDDVFMTIVRTIYDRYQKDLLMASSAKGVHHVGAGGNMLHTIEVFNVATAICDQFPGYGINKSLVQAGALLHDIGKAQVYEIEGPSVDYTMTGHMLDHIMAGTLMLADLGQEEEFAQPVKLLTHIIASHHGKLEYGSPVLPKFIEAYIVNFADGISATLDTLKRANDNAPANSDVTERIFTHGNVPHITQAFISKMLTPPELDPTVLND